MKVTKQLRKIGNSLGFTFDKKILKKLKADEGDFLEADIKKVGENE